MTDLRTAAQQALEALEYGGLLKKRQAITALRAALAEPEPTLNLDTLMRCIDHHAAELFRLRAKVQQLEALPQRKPLTDDEIDRITDQEWAANNHKPIYAAHRAFARAIERAHWIGEKE